MLTVERIKYCLMILLTGPQTFEGRFDDILRKTFAHSVILGIQNCITKMSTSLPLSLTYDGVESHLSNRILRNAFVKQLFSLGMIFCVFRNQGIFENFIEKTWLSRVMVTFERMLCSMKIFGSGDIHDNVSHFVVR